MLQVFLPKKNEQFVFKLLINLYKTSTLLCFTAFYHTSQIHKSTKITQNPFYTKFALKKQGLKALLLLCFKWSGRRGSNSRHPPWQHEATVKPNYYKLSYACTWSIFARLAKQSKTTQNIVLLHKYYTKFLINFIMLNSLNTLQGDLCHKNSRFNIICPAIIFHLFKWLIQILKTYAN